MSRNIRFIGILITLLLLASCASYNKKETKQEVEKKFNLENYLIQDGYVQLEMKKMLSGHLHLFGQINGVNGNFVLDTGASATVIEEKNKEKFKMQTLGTEGMAVGAGGTGMQVQVSETNNLKIGELDLTGQNLILMNLDHVNNAFKSMGLQEVDGVIGADILTNGKAIIDYSNLILYLKNRIAN